MSTKLSISKVNETYIRIDCESGIAHEISDHFTFLVPNARFHPLVKNKVWDGRIRLYNVMTKLLYTGLLPTVQEFAAQRNYEIELLSDFNDTEFSLHETKQFVDSLNVPNIEFRDYQIAALNYAVRKSRALLLSPTASGKSLIIYSIFEYYRKRTLIIVPTVSLVSQMATDFESYGFKEDIHKIYSGVDKNIKEDVVISTWQSIYKMPRQWFAQFDVVIGDEAHLFKAKNLTLIMEKMSDCKYRFGFTGTLDGTETNKMVLEGLFGKVKRVASTTDLIEKKHLANLTIKVLLLKYSDEIRKQCKGIDYPTEMDFIVSYTPRNRFIQNLTLSLKGNVLLLFQYVEKHGKELYQLLNANKDNRKVFFVHGGVDGDEREKIRKLVETEKDAIIVASSGVFSTGVNIKNLHNIVFASPSKSKIRTLQSIGRGLRKSETKEDVILFDIADDLTWKSKTNFTFEHYKERVRIYKEENFNYKIFNIDIKGDK